MEEKKSHSAMSSSSSSSSSPSSSTSSLPFSAPVDIAKPSPSPTSQSQPQSKEKPTKSARKSIEKKSPTSGSAECLFAKASIRKCMKFNSDVHNISGMYVCMYVCMYACMQLSIRFPLAIFLFLQNIDSTFSSCRGSHISCI